ncbi:MAG TPA: outer membrane protein assembly factor BamD [Candidatus Sulfotelmatobacter sp.]|nr:outer membrane protein assembly factor BamD [Candidatus Sulfotelmatobacter sp.]
MRQLIVLTKRPWLFILLVFALAFGASLDAGAQLQKKSKKKQPAKTDTTDTSQEPDKVLYERAASEIKHGHYTEGRLAYQTLINTYPDSEYLAKAKLGLADSYFKEGGTSNLTQAVSEYKDFGTFFPFLDEAAYAQMQVGMCHYKMMEKSDRDTAHAQSAEDEFQAMLLKYPQSKYAPEAEQHLREVQEILADGEYRIARFYYTKQDYRASAARLMEITDRYPLYSQSDEALWYLGNVYMWAKAKTPSANEDLRNYWSDQAAKCYERIVRDYPLSVRMKDAKARLSAMSKPIPAPDPDALARMQKEQLYAKTHHRAFALKAPLGMLKSGPDVAMAAHSGAPNLNPPTDVISASDVLKPGAAGPTFGISASTTAASTDSNAAPTTQVDATPVGGLGSGSGSATTVGVRIIEVPGSTNPSTASPAPPPSAAPAPAPSGQPPAESSSSSSSAPAAGPDNAAPAPQPAPAQNGTGDASAQSSGQSSSSAPAAASGESGSQSSGSSSDSGQESTSKKKKGIRKIIPW